MSIYCGCDSYDGPEGEWLYYAPEDWKVLDTKRGRRCCSCNALIKVGEECGEFKRERSPKNDIEERIYGEDACDIPMSSLWMCEECTGLYFSIIELGYCVFLPSDMRENARLAGGV